MDIHKPKPVHSWREFLSEIAVIVCGILIALAGEQVVEAFHWRHEVEAQREALRSEARDNLSAAAYRQAEAPCIDRRLAELEDGFRRQAQGAPIGFRQPFARPPIWVASTGAWDIALSGQALGHMSHKEKLAFSDAFDAYKAFARLRNDEDVVWRRLVLINHREVLGPGDWVELHQAWGEAVGTNDRMKTLLTYINGEAALGQTPQPIASADAADLKAFCTSLY